MTITRRISILQLGALFLLSQSAVSAPVPGEQRAGMSELQKQMITALPVLPWLNLGETTQSDVRAPIQQLISSHRGHIMVTDGISVETGGAFINLASAGKHGLMGIPGANMLRLDFDGSNKAQLVELTVDRGWRNKNAAPLLQSLSGRYSSITPPVTIRDGESEASDSTVLFDIGRFVVEAQIPQHGTYLTVTFTTKELLKKLRTADGTVKPLLPYLQSGLSKG